MKFVGLLFPFRWGFLSCCARGRAWQDTCTCSSCRLYALQLWVGKRSALGFVSATSRKNCWNKQWPTPCFSVSLSWGESRNRKTQTRNMQDLQACHGAQNCFKASRRFSMAFVAGDPALVFLRHWLWVTLGYPGAGRDLLMVQALLCCYLQMLPITTQLLKFSVCLSQEAFVFSSMTTTTEWLMKLISKPPKPQKQPWFVSVTLLG